MPRASVIVPAFNVADTLPDTLRSLLDQSFADFEIIVVDDGSSDQTADIARSTGDPRVRLVRQRNRGLAGARNTGIAHARGEYIGFCDADDLWRPRKLAAHVAHLDANPQVGLSFSGSEMIDASGRSLGFAQSPQLSNISTAHVLLRNPVGNGSAAILRRAALRSISWWPEGEQTRAWVFDETFRQSEDIECWLRLSLITDWKIEGVDGLLTQYRIVSGGLSASTDRQLQAWEAMVRKLTPVAPEFFARHTATARAYQLRYLARRAVSDGDGRKAILRLWAAFGQSWQPLFHEPVKTAATLAGAIISLIAGRGTMTIARRLLRQTV